VLFSLLLAIALAMQAGASAFQEPTLNLRHVLNDNAALSSVKVWYSADGQMIELHGTGVLLVQSTRRNLSLLPTCTARINPEGIRTLLQEMETVHFLGLPLKSYLIVNGDQQDWERLRLHSIIIKVGERTIRRDFAAGEYGAKPQQIPQQFAIIEHAILQLKAQVIRPETPCTLAPSLWSEHRSKSQ
jgi:hypothetical protein